jgi:hypothetical protein
MAIVATAYSEFYFAAMHHELCVGRVDSSFSVGRVGVFLNTGAVDMTFDGNICYGS